MYHCGSNILVYVLWSQHLRGSLRCVSGSFFRSRAVAHVFLVGTLFAGRYLSTLCVCRIGVRLFKSLKVWFFLLLASVAHKFVSQQVRGKHNSETSPKQGFYISLPLHERTVMLNNRKPVRRCKPAEFSTSHLYLRKYRTYQTAIHLEASYSFFFRFPPCMVRVLRFCLCSLPSNTLSDFALADNWMVQTTLCCRVQQSIDCS